MPETHSVSDIPRLARSLRDVALLFNVASNSKRLEVLLLLSGGRKSTKEIRETLGCERRVLGQHLQALAQGRLIAAEKAGSVKTYRLSEGGSRLIRAIRLKFGLPNEDENSSEEEAA